MENTHIVKKFDKNLDKLKTRILEMGELVNHQVEDATAMLGAFDPTEVERILLLDLTVNGLHKEVYDRAELLITRRQPLAQDLRQTLAPINIAGELERIGDHAKSTAKRGRILCRNSTEETVLDMIQQMSTKVQKMLVDVLIAYANDDIELAAEVRAQDKDVDTLNKMLVKCVIDTLDSQASGSSESLVQLTLISRNFERIGDHACNIARYVHQISTGEDLKASI